MTDKSDRFRMQIRINIPKELLRSDRKVYIPSLKGMIEWVVFELEFFSEVHVDVMMVYLHYFLGVEFHWGACEGFCDCLGVLSCGL